MRYSLVSREIIADGVEAVARGHAYDALVTFAGCDKTLPGNDDGDGAAQPACRVRLRRRRASRPWQGRDVTVLDTYEAVGGSHGRHVCTESELDELERVCLPTLGSCPGQFTANTMAMVSETLGLALPGSATLPAVRRAAQRDCPSGRRGRHAAAEERRTAAARAGDEEKPGERLRRRSRRPAARPTPRCIFRRSRTRPASASRSTTSRASRSARRSSPT